MARIAISASVLETVRVKGVVGHEPRLSKQYPAFQYFHYQHQVVICGGETFTSK